MAWHPSPLRSSLLTVSVALTVAGCSNKNDGPTPQTTAGTPDPDEPTAPATPGDAFRYLPTLRKAVPEAGSAAIVLESERRTHGDLWVLVADVRTGFGGLGIDAYHFAPRPEDAVLVPDTGPLRLLSFDGETGDDARRDDLRRRFAAPQTKTTGPAAGYAQTLADATDPAQAVALLAERSRIVADRSASAEARARAYAELLGLIKDGPFRGRASLEQVVDTFRTARFLEVVPGSESRLGLSVRLVERPEVVVFERLPGSPPTGLVVSRIERGEDRESGDTGASGDTGDTSP